MYLNCLQTRMYMNHRVHFSVAFICTRNGILCFASHFRKKSCISIHEDNVLLTFFLLRQSDLQRIMWYLPVSTPKCMQYSDQCWREEKRKTQNEEKKRKLYWSCCWCCCLKAWFKIDQVFLGVTHSSFSTGKCACLINSSIIRF